MVKDFKFVLGVRYVNYFFLFSVARWEEVATLMACSCGEATFGMPLGMGSAMSVPSGIGPESKKPGATMLIHCNQGTLALMTHLVAKKLLEIGT